ncbi:MAG: hypothetical protein CNIPEHKO_01741 [Anaerolineales bacterium]|nr:hypothetical protein [Anaerolineales bacterium]
MSHQIFGYEPETEVEISVQDLEQCLWARSHASLRSIIKTLMTDLQNSSALHARMASPQHNFLPVFCLPPDSTVTLLRSRIALPRKQKQVVQLQVVQLQLSLCLPIAVYGETCLSLSAQGYAYNFLRPESLGVVTTPDLQPVERTVATQLHIAGIKRLTPRQAAMSLPESLKLPLVATYLDALFMKYDYPY